MKKLAFFTGCAALSVLLSSCYLFFENRNTINSSGEDGSLYDLLHAEAIVTDLDAPTQLIASQGIYSGEIHLKWNEVENATSYRLERAIVTDGSSTIPEEADFFTLKEFVYGTSYTDAILSEPSASNTEYGYKYYYRVCAENISKGLNASDYTSNSVEATAGVGWLLPPPQKIEAWKGKATDEIQVSWEAVENAEKYLIYRGTSASGNGMGLVASVFANKTVYSDSISTDEQGVEFYYSIYVRTTSGTLSAPSALAMGYSLQEGAPSAPENVRVVDGLGSATSGLVVAWDKFEASDANTTITYSLYKTSSASSVYSLVKSGLSSTTLTYTDTTAKPGLYYYYYLQTQATDATTLEVLKSAFSETGPDSTSPAMGYLLTPPSDIEIADGSTADSVIIRWAPALGSELSGITYSYNVYSCTEENGTYTILAQAVSGLLSDDGYYEAEVAKQNFYKMTTVNASGVESSLSGAAAPLPSAPENVVASKTQILDSSWAANELGVYPVKITWSAPESDNPAGYYVYRSEKASSSFRKLTENPVTDLYYVDENSTAKAGKYYFYKVVSLNVLNQGNKSNNPEADTANNCRGYGAIARDQWFKEYNKTIKSSQDKLTLMHKSNDMDKLGSESVNGDISGTLSYNAAIAGLGAKITMHYENYADHYINSDSSEGIYFCITGNTDTSASMDASGSMSGTVICTGMYPGTAVYNNLQIKGGAAGGGYYLVETQDLNGSTVLSQDQVNWLIGEED